MCYDNKPFQYQTFNSLKVNCVDYRNLNISKQNAFIYDCNYVMKTCLSQHLCSIYITYVKTLSNLDLSFLLCYFKAYENQESLTFGNLTMPHEEFTIFIN